MIVVEEIDERRQTVKGWDRAAGCAFAKAVSAMPVEERTRAYRRAGRRWEPLALFVDEGGAMVSGSLVNRVFETANRRIWSWRGDAGALGRWRCHPRCHRTGCAARSLSPLPFTP